MVGVEHLAGVYLTNPPTAGSPAIGVVIIAILAGFAVLAWLQDDLAHR